jgi:hypothetical protein
MTHGFAREILKPRLWWQCILLKFQKFMKFWIIKWGILGEY